MAQVDTRLKVFIDLDTLNRVRQAAAADSDYMRTAIEMAYLFGSRRGELISLYVGGFDFIEDRVQLEMSKNGDPREAPPRLPRASGQGGHWKLDEKFVPVGRDGFSDDWGKIRHQADADRFFVHDCRHTSAKRKREAGVPTSVIMMFER